MRLLILALTAVITLTACGDDDAAPSPTPIAATATPTSAPSATLPPLTNVPLASDHALYFVRSDGNIYRVPAGGGDVAKFTDGDPCLADTSLAGRQLAFSPSGDTLACVATRLNSDTANLVLYNRAGEVTAATEITPDSTIEWSPDGQWLTYMPNASSTGTLTILDRGLEVRAQRGPVERGGPSIVSSGRPRYWAPNISRFAYLNADTKRLHVITLDNANDAELTGGYIPLTWRNDRELLVARNYSTDDRGFQTYEVSTLNISSGDLTRIPALDSGPDSPEPDLNRQGWVSPDGRYVALLTRQSGADFQGLGIYDMEATTFTVIAGSSVSFGSDHIPRRYVWFSADSTQLFWLDESSAIYRANVDGTGTTPLVELQGTPGDLSPDYKSSVITSVGDIMQIAVSNPDGSTLTILDSSPASGAFAARAFAWDPRPDN